MYLIITVIGLASNLILFCLQCNLTDSESGSLSALNMSEDEYLEDNVMDNSFASSTLNQSTQQGD